MFSQMSIKKQLTVSGILCSALAIAIALFAYRGLNRVENTLVQIADASVVLSNHQQADMMHEGLRGDVYSALLAGKDGAATQDAVKSATHKHATEFRKMIAQNKQLLGDGPIKGKLGSAEQEMEKYISMAEAQVALAFEDNAAAAQGVEAFEKEFNRLEDLMGSVSGFIENENVKAKKTGIETAASAVRTVAIVSVVALGAILFVSFVIPRRITRALDKIHELAENVVAASANGNLAVRADVNSNDEVGDLGRHLNKILENFSSAMTEIRDASDRLAAVAKEVATVNREASIGVTRQQGETEQVAAAFNEMTATVQEIAANAVQAAHSARQGNDDAVNSRRIVTEAIQSMDVLSQQVNRTVDVLQTLKTDSGNIGVVLDVIRSIAEQTNLLALNAAIEAARAGEQGRGFAVVADEVRTLAQRTQQSTREIQEMIQRLQTGVGEVAATMEQGQQQTRATVEKVSEAGTSLESITSAVGVITDMSTQIATATEEQSKVAEEINRNIANINYVGEQTAVAAQRATQSTDEISALAHNLEALVKRFTLN